MSWIGKALGKLEVVMVGAFSRIGRNVRAHVVHEPTVLCNSSRVEQRKVERRARDGWSCRYLHKLLPAVVWCAKWPPRLYRASATGSVTDCEGVKVEARVAASQPLVRRS